MLSTGILQYMLKTPKKVPKWLYFAHKTNGQQHFRPNAMVKNYQNIKITNDENFVKIADFPI